MSKRYLLLLTFLIILIIAIAAIYFISHSKPTTSTDITSSAIVNVEFPKTEEDYPADWPEELKFPPEIILVDSKTGFSADGNKKGWMAKFRFHGNPQNAERIIANQFKELDWTISEKHEFDSGGYLLLIEKEDGDGIITIEKDPNENTQSIILATYFP